MENDTLKKMIEAAEAGGKIVKSYFGSLLEITEKSMAADVRTRADVESEEAVLSILEKAFPNYNIHSEERDFIDKKSEFTFIVDPLDGTNNFVLGIPQVSVAIALMKGDETVAAVIHNPLLALTYTGERGKGSYINGERMMVNKEEKLDRSTIAVHCAYATTPKEKGEIAERVYSLSPKRMLSSWAPLLDFCLLANGKIEGLTSTILNLYDFIPGKLIASEAGAKITDFGGKSIGDKEPQFIISNGTGIHQALISIQK